MMEKVIILDASEILTILKRTGTKSDPLQGLNALTNRGDKFFFNKDFSQELIDSQEWESKKGQRLQQWLEDNSKHIVSIDPVEGEKEENFYDPEGKRNSNRGGKERADMAIRKFMWVNRVKYEFEVIGRDIDLLDNNVGEGHPLNGLKFDRLSTRSALTWLSAHPDVPLPRDKFTALTNRLEAGKFDLSPERAVHELEVHRYEIPKNYEYAQKFIKDTQDRKVGERFTKLFRNGAPALVLGLAAVPVFSMVKARAEERSIPFAQAARELGLDFSEDDLKGLAADVGVDLAVSLTPVGVVKKAWDVLGNIDDIVAVTQLYGEAYPDNPVIQELAELATTVEGSETFKAYVYGRDALTGAVGGVIDGMLGDSGDEEETAEALAHLRASLQEGGAAQQAANSGATQAELAETLTFDLRQRMAAQQSLFAAEPTATADAPLTAPRPDAAALSGDTVLSDEKHVPMSAMPGLPGSAPLPQPSFTRDTVQSSLMSAEPMATAKTPLSAPQPDAASLSPDAGRMDGARSQAPASAGVDARTNREPFARRTSYDTYRRLGLTPEEEAQAVEEFRALVKESYVDMGGDMEAAQLLAGRLFAFDWGLSAFAQAPEGTVLKHPVEKVYPELEGAGHDYIRSDVEAFLEAQGIKAARWYLTPNEKTGRDRKKAWMD
ncbi:hypothetical protein ACFFVJ_19660, partial [Roseibium salinum]|uniref:hypothetical protein n=1 Tax=Roseibium salinum TaxID=1604349 RepID=UPI0035E96669